MWKVKINCTNKKAIYVFSFSQGLGDNVASISPPLRGELVPTTGFKAFSDCLDGANKKGWEIRSADNIIFFPVMFSLTFCLRR